MIAHRLSTVRKSEILNLQPNGLKPKAYQVKQVRNLIIKYRLGDSNVN